MLASNIKKEAFSLLEVVIAIGIVVIAFVGVVGSVSHTLQLNYSARNNFLASYLAEECMEAIRYKRDYNIKTNKPFYTGLAVNSVGTTTNFGIDWTLATTSLTVVSSTAAALKVSTSTGYVIASNANCVVSNNNGCSTSTFDRMASVVYMIDSSMGPPFYYLNTTCQVFWQDRDLTNIYQTHTKLYDYAQ